MLADESYSNVAEAIQEGILLKEQDMYTCRVCDTTMSGVTPAKAHLQGVKHKKVLQRFQLNAAASQSICDGAAKSVDPDVLAAIKNGLVKSENLGNILRLTCVPCQKSCTGDLPMLQHLTSDAHAKKIKQDELALRFSPPMETSISTSTPTSRTSITPTPRTTITPTPRTTITPTPRTTITPTTRTTVTPITRTTVAQNLVSSTRTVLGNEVGRAMDQGIVIQAAYGYLDCTVCRIRCNGKDTMKEHLMGKSHMKNQAKPLNIHEQPVTTVERRMETVTLKQTSPPPAIIPPPPQFLDAQEMKITASREIKYQELGGSLQDVPVSFSGTFHQIPCGDVSDIRIYKPEESLSDIFKE